VTYLLIAFVIAMALAPLTHFVPGKRQRQVMHLREFAALQGLFVEFREVPTLGSAPRYRLPRQSGSTIYYGKRMPAAGRRREGRHGVWLHGAQGWQGKRAVTPVPAPLQTLPSGVLAASLDENSCGIYWLETGGEAEIEQIHQVLCELSEQFMN